MKKVISIVLVSCLLFTACNINDYSINSLNNNTESYKSNNSSNIEITEPNSETTTILLKNNKDIKEFVDYRMSNVDDWIYYSINNQLRKCKLDLTEDTLLENNILYFLRTTKNSVTEIYQADLDNNEFYSEKITQLKNANNLIIIDHYIVYTNFENELIKYDIDKNIITKNIAESVASFSIVDQFVYYNLCNDNIIYRYDINTGKREAFFEFKKHDDFQPKVYYINRIILIQTDINKFIYTDIDNITLRNISFDISEYERVWTALYSNDNDSLYFNISEHYDVANPATTPRSIYKVKIGTEESELVKIITGDNLGSVIEGYLYSFDYNDNIFREAFY